MTRLISEALEKRLNQHIQWEQESAQIYFAMGAWARFNGYNKVGEFFFKHGNEELSHAKKVIDYIDEKDCYAVMPMVARPDTSAYKTAINLFKLAFDHEVFVTNTYKELATMAIKEGDFEVMRFAQEMLSEQREETDTFNNILDMLEINANNPNLPAILEDEIENF